MRGGKRELEVEGRKLRVSKRKPQVFSRDVNCVKALAEIFDFVAGLMQSVPKKTSIAMSDLLNTTAILPRKKNFEEERISFKEVLYIYLHLS